jgi:uncharacterized glyoxalase superfamily protein PhnB
MKEGKDMSNVGVVPAKIARATIIPGMRYRNAPAAIEWLCTAFGFEKQLVVPGPSGTMAHAQLTFGNGMIMLGSGHDNEYGRLIKQPDEIGGAQTQSAYVIVPDADAHCARAKAAGAEIVIDIKDESYGGRGYTCGDLEGHIWNFGTYNPWKE